MLQYFHSVDWYVYSAVCKYCWYVCTTIFMWIYKEFVGVDVLEDKKLLHWRRLQDVFKSSSLRWMFAGVISDPSISAKQVTYSLYNFAVHHSIADVFLKNLFLKKNYWSSTKIFYAKIFAIKIILWD